LTIVRGYAVVFGRVIRTADYAPFVVPRGAVNLAGAGFPLLLDHDATLAVTGTSKGMQVWADDFGVRFEAEVHDGALVDEIRYGQRAQVSAEYDPIVVRHGTWNNEPVEFFDRVRIREISIVALAACPDTAVWPADAPREQLRERQLRAARMWAMAAFRDRERARGVSGTARAAAGHGRSSSPLKRPAPDSVLALMRSAPWMEGALAAREARRMMEACRRH
jgi:hypothetical protein